MANIHRLEQPQVIECRGAFLDRNSTHATIMIKPYPGMSAGDRLDIYWEGDKQSVYHDHVFITQSIVGKPLEFVISDAEISPNTQVNIKYTVTTADDSLEDSPALVIRLEETSYTLEDLTSVELDIRASSGNTAPNIYANGNNQLAIQIIAKATRTDSDYNDVIIHASDAEWKRKLSLCDAGSDKKLTRKGTSGWCYAENPNEFCREISSFMNAAEDITVDQYSSGAVIIHFYLYTTEINTKRIAVCLDLDNGKHFTTSDLASGAERMSVQTISRAPLTYNTTSSLNVSDLGWVNKGTSYERRSQVRTSRTFIKNNCVIRYRLFNITLNNGYQIAKKKLESTGLPSNYVELKWTASQCGVAAVKLANNSKGGYLNFWYVEPENSYIGYADDLNKNYTGMGQSGWPAFYFSGEPSGDYNFGVWVYWPRFDQPSPRPYHYVSGNPDNIIQVYCYQLHIPNTSEIYWGKNCKPKGDDISNPAKVSFTDNYGNQNTLTITFQDSPDGDIRVGTAG